MCSCCIEVHRGHWETLFSASGLAVVYLCAFLNATKVHSEKKKKQACAIERELYFPSICRDSLCNELVYNRDAPLRDYFG